MILQIDRNETNKIELAVFDTICQQFKVHLSNEELTKIKAKYCDLQEPEQQTEEPVLLNYIEFSLGVQLHKDSFSFMRNLRSYNGSIQ